MEDEDGLLLWRHAEAEEGEDDLKRRLTGVAASGRGSWPGEWGEHRRKDLHVIVSPAVRTQQTAEALKLPFATVRTIGPDAGVADLIAACGWPDAGGAVLVVGHQPVLGQLAHFCWPVGKRNGRSRRGALVVEQPHPGDEAQTVLRAVIPVELLGRQPSRAFN